MIMAMKKWKILAQYNYNDDTKIIMNYEHDKATSKFNKKYNFSIECFIDT